MPFVRSGDGGGIASPAFVKYLTWYSINDSGAIAQKSYTIPADGCYIVLCITSAINQTTLSGFEHMNASLNDADITPKRLWDDSENSSMNNKGFIIEGVITQALQNDVLKVSTTGTSGTSKCTALYIMRFMFDDYNQSNLSIVACSDTKLNTGDTTYTIDLENDLGGKSCFGLTFMRRDNTSGYNAALVASKTDKTDTIDDTLVNLTDSGTSWCIRARLFYPQRYGTADSLLTHTGNSNGVNYLSKVVVFGV